mgnify:CR=1 FL=1|jgi:hypothetical protein
MAVLNDEPPEVKPGTWCLSPKGELVEVVTISTYGIAVTWKYEDRDRLLHAIQFSSYAVENLTVVPDELTVLLK